jgi:hypothetical protein
VGAMGPVRRSRPGQVAWPGICTMEAQLTCKVQTMAILMGFPSAQTDGTFACMACA